MEVFQVSISILSYIHMIVQYEMMHVKGNNK
jgi:hypothetical protein